MTITAEDVIYGLGLLVQEGDAGSYHVNVDEARVLLAHIDSQTAKLDAAMKQCQELAKQSGRLGARAAIAERELIQRDASAGEPAGYKYFVHHPEVGGWHMDAYPMHEKTLDDAVNAGRISQYHPVYATPQFTPSIAATDVLSEKFIDWVCLTCVEVRNAFGDYEAQEGINEIRQSLEDKAKTLRLNNGSKPFIVKIPKVSKFADGLNAGVLWIKAIRAAGGEVAE